MPQGDKPEDPAYMFFDFRKGNMAWPENVSLVSPEVAEGDIQKLKDEAEKAASKQGGTDVNSTSVSGGGMKMEGFGNTDVSLR